MAGIVKTDPDNPQHPFPQDLRTKRDTIVDRNQIIESIRYSGMLVYVDQEQKLYYLKGGIDNSYFKRILDEDDLIEGAYIPFSWVDSNANLSANSDQKIATQKAVKSYVDAATKKSKTTLEVTSGLTVNWDGTVPSGGQTFREKHGEDFQFQGYRTVDPDPAKPGLTREVNYSPTVIPYRDGSGNIVEVEFADVFPGRIIII